MRYKGKNSSFTPLTPLLWPKLPLGMTGVDEFVRSLV